MSELTQQDARRSARGRRQIAMIVLAAALLVGTQTSGAGTPTATAIAASTPAATGCSGNAAGGALTVTIAGYRRTVIVHLPSGYTHSTRLPLVLSMHGSGSTAGDHELFTGMDAAADADRFIVAYPQGLISDSAGYDWNVPGEPLIGGRAVPAGAANDVTFLTELVGLLEQRYCINPARVFATGFSGGARIASQLACDSAGVFAAVAAVSGLRHPTPCPASRPVPIVAFHGTADPVDPYGGHGQAYWTYSVPQGAADWAQQDGCAKTPTVSRLDGGVTLTDYSHCRGSATVELYTIAGEGHEWPGGPPLPKALTNVLGPQTTAINANAIMWAFFEAHPLRAAPGRA